MKQTVFKNASGLPDSGQLTTARDMAILARALMSRFPDYYEFFNTQSFRYNGRTYQTHNRVLKNYPGADGLKTGYTRASGYNLATSAERNGHRLIGIVLGGKSARGRDAQMMSLLDEGFVLADSGAMSVATSLPSAQRPAEKEVKPAPADLGVSIAMIPPVKPAYEIDNPNAVSLDSLVAQVVPTAEAEGDGGIIAEALAAPAPTQVALRGACRRAPAKAADSGKVTWGIQVGAFTAEQPAAKAATAATEEAAQAAEGHAGGRRRDHRRGRQQAVPRPPDRPRRTGRAQGLHGTAEPEHALHGLQGQRHPRLQPGAVIRLPIRRRCPGAFQRRGDIGL